MDHLEKEAKERKRDRMMDPAVRWRQILEMITWAEANMKPEFRRNRPRYRDAEGRVVYFK